jgi:pimeloyl-ACP methyl ester carboxylesterase
MFLTMIILASVVGLLAAAAIAALGWRAVHRRRLAAVMAIRTPNGIVEHRFVRIGGVEQWIGIRGEDQANPVLLVLHGGPGSPYSVFTPLLRSWEKHFTVVQWDRRGAGRTLGRSGKPGVGELTFDRMVDDGIEVAEFLRQHLGKEKVVLLAGSMGTLVGTPLVQRRPDLFDAYVSTDCYVDMARNEAMGYQLALDRVRAAGNTKGVAALERIGADPSRWDAAAWGVKMQWAMKTDPVSPDAMKLIFKLLLTSPEYRLRDVGNWLAGFGSVRDQTFSQFITYDARRFGTSFQIPVFLFPGDQDVITLTSLAEEYYTELQGPAKGLVLIPNASHFCAFTQPEEFLAALLSQVLPVVAASQPTASSQALKDGR